MAELDEVLAKIETLTTLDLSKSGIGPEGAQSLARALETNETLTEINLCGNVIGDFGAEVLAQALESNSTLQYIWLDDTTINPEIVERIQRRRIRVKVGKGLGQKDQSVRQLARLARVVTETCKARAARDKALAFMDNALEDVLLTLAHLDDPLAGLYRFGPRMRVIESRFKDYVELDWQEAVIVDSSRAQRKEQLRTELVQHMRSVVSDGLEDSVRSLTASRETERALTACEQAWSEIFCTHLTLREPSSSFGEVKTAGRALRSALARWKARHDVSRRHEWTSRARAALTALGQVKVQQDLAIKMALVERTLRTELAALNSTDPLADAPLNEIRTALTHLGSFFAVTVPVKTQRWCSRLDLVKDQLARLVQSTRVPAATEE